ncbi:hypothetical protein GGS24DRAFT_453917 [Hypoxylon argillaceum]|nr:hypothetical protein GGS24DRAFT_453917 [Hypoxylon argillaceum]
MWHKEAAEMHLTKPGTWDPDTTTCYIVQQLKRFPTSKIGRMSLASSKTTFQWTFVLAMFQKRDIFRNRNGVVCG